MNYGKDFNQWFSDRFNMRTELISLDATYKCILTKNYYKRNNIIFDKKNKVIYSNSFWGMNEIKKNKDKTFSAIAQKLERLNNYCKQNNIKLYLLIVPRRSDFVTVSKSNNQKHFDYGVELIEYLKKNTNVDIIYPYEELQQANKITPVYFKTDHHWSKKGAYIGYKALMNEIKKIYPDINIVNDENLEPYYHNLVNSTYQNIFTRGSLNKQLGLFNIYIDKFLDTPYMYYKNPEKRNFVIKNKANWPNFDPETDLDVYYEKGYDKKVLLLGDSFNINLIDFLPLSFKRVLLYPVNRRNMKFSRYENIIKIYKPDIIVITMRIFYLKNLNNLYDDNHKKGRLK